MRHILIALILVLAMVPARAQDTEENVANCGNTHDDELIISGCTGLLQAKPEISTDWQIIAYFGRGNAYSHKGLQDLAIADFTNAIALKPDDTTILAHLHGAIGLAYYRKHLYAESITNISTMITLKPDEGIGYVRRGSAYELSGQRDKAIADYRMALKFYPNDRILKTSLTRLGVNP
jgi:lipoprotein NlpI